MCFTEVLREIERKVVKETGKANAWQDWALKNLQFEPIRDKCDEEYEEHRVDGNSAPLTGRRGIVIRCSKCGKELGFRGVYF